MNDLRGRKILVTGGTGFIGSQLVQELIKNQAEVSVIDINLPKNSFFSLNSLHKKVNFQKIDIREKAGVDGFFQSNDLHYVIHLAAVASVINGYDDPFSTFQTNIMGTVNVLEGARKKGSTKGIIIASSDKAYGKTNEAYTENFVLKGEDPFGVSKSSSDLISQAYFKTYKLPVAITRFSNVYGEGDLHFDRLIPELCKMIIEKKELKIRSDGTFRRDYIYIKDVVRGYITLLQNMDKVCGEAYNFSSKDNLSVLEVADKAEKAIGQKINFKIVNNSKNELPYQHLDDSKVRKLGWKNEFDFDTTFKSILSWYKQIL